MSEICQVVQGWADREKENLENTDSDRLAKEGTSHQFVVSGWNFTLRLSYKQRNPGNMKQQIRTTAELVAHNSLTDPEKPFLLFYDEVVTFKDLNEKTDAFANYLSDNGVGKGDVVSFMVGNNPEFFYSMIGAQKIGAIAGPISCWLQAPEVEFLINASKSKIFIVDHEYAGIVSSIKDKIPLVKKIIINSLSPIDTDIDHDYLPQIIVDHSGEFVSENPPVETDKAALMFTSGTTGEPKGVQMTHRNIIKACLAKMNSIPIRRDDRALCVLPLFHTGGLFDMVIPCMYNGSTVVLRRNFSATEFWESVEQYKVSVFLVVPTILNILLRTPLAEEVDTSLLRFGLSGASPIPPEHLEECEKRFGFPVIEAYGATENTGGITVNRIDKRKTGSIGFGLEGIDVKIFDKKGNQVPDGIIGEVVVRGETVMKGYLNNPAETSETIKNGWLYTGDLGYVDNEGFFFIVDRKKDMIIRGGVNVYPKELENIIGAHPKIDRVAVIPEPHDKFGQVAKACIVLKRGEAMTIGEIRGFCFDKMAVYKNPEIILFRESLPTSVLGKVIKKDLIIELEEEKTTEPVPVGHFFEGMPERFIPEKSEGVDASVSYNITGKGGGKWTIHIKENKMVLTEEILADPTVYIVAKDADYHDIATGKIDGITAVMTGKLKIEGDVNFVVRLREMMKPLS